MLKPEQKCRVCKRSTEFVSAEILLQRAVSYFECQNCGFIQTEAPYWLEEAYTETINLSDTGIVARNLTNRKFVIPTLFALGGLHKKVVAAGFENDGSQAFFVTAFEAFEHFVDPRSELEKMLAKAPNVLLSANFISKSISKFDDWWHYGTDHGQHISFYRKNTLQYLAEIHEKHFVSNGHDYHLFSNIPVSELKWRALLRRQKLVNFAVGFSLKSKTWSDHLHISQKDGP